MIDRPDISVVLSTYNRCDILPAALDSLVVQEAPGVQFEVLVVDNNSSDDTRSVVRGYAARDRRIHYVFEPKQGLSHGLNTGISRAAGAIVALTDDDLVMPRDWIANVKKAFDGHPEAAFIGSRVLPQWLGSVPPWLTRDVWAALALQDADAEFYTDAANPVCLIGKSFRRDVLLAVGGFRPDLGRIKDTVGSIEDDELQRRLWAQGFRGMHVPSVVLLSPVATERLAKSYFRRWYQGHGRYYALLRPAELERSVGRLVDVPLALYRQAFENLAAWLGATLLRRHDVAFSREMQLRFFAGFFRQRCASVRAGGGSRSLFREVLALPSALLGRRTVGTP
jgi:glycosyltransferase involved in cell wall biosynthesis